MEGVGRWEGAGRMWGAWREQGGCVGRWKGAGRMRVEWAAITGRCSRTNLGHVDILARQVALQQQGDLLELMSRLVQPLS
eukprot:scaffold567_cov127-Isochrysis_galbana.AAC.1